MLEPVKLKKSIWRIIGQIVTIGLIIYIGFLLGRSTWHNYETNKQITDLNKELKALNQTNQNLQNEIIYYQTESFKELEARRRLGLKKQGENVIALPNSSEKEISTGNVNWGKKNESANSSAEPNYIAWFHYIIK